MKKLAMHKIFDVPILAYEMDYYQYIPPSHLMRLTSTTAFGALWTYGYSYLDLLNELGATWMMGMVDMHVHKDLSVTREPELISMYASPLYRTPANFMIRVIARHGEEAVSTTDVCVLVVNFKERRVLHTDEVVARLGSPKEAIVLPPPERLQMPEDLEFVMDQPVRFYDCDRNQHLNAYRYADYICQAGGYWDHGKHVKADRLRIEYDRECRPGETLTIAKREIAGDGTYVQGNKQDGTLSFKALLKLEEAAEC